MKILYGAFILLTFLIFFTTRAAAESRKDLLVHFVKYNQASNGAFRDSNNSTSTEMTPFISYANVYIATRLDKMKEINNETAKTWFYDQYRYEDQNNLAAMYYSLQGYYLLRGTINSTELDGLKDIIVSKADPNNMGYRTLDHNVATVVATYYAVNLLKNMSRTSLINADNVSTYLMSLYSASTGGFAGSNQSNANIIDTYYAIRTLYLLGKIYLITPDMKSAILNYTESFYCNDPNLTVHYGGYSYSKLAPLTSILLTYYCTQILKTMNGTLHQETLSWILARQSPYDFGFQDISENFENQYSSAISSYYALEIILTLDQKGIEGQLEKEVWNLKADPWIVAAIVIGSVAGTILLIYGIYRLKNRL